MSEQSAKPYLIRAICEWCADNGLTPYLAVKVNRQTQVPAAYVKNGEIVLNISVGATRRLTVDNEHVQFTARFDGASKEVSVPMAAVSGVFAKETGYGFAFAMAADPAASLHAATAPTELPAAGASSSPDNKPRGRQTAGALSSPDNKPRGRPKHLQVVK